ncbi:VOC family protein [Nocardioides sp. GY 10127]|nr:VOC family protein [Nocardioides sp. GY 10127]
MTVPDLDEATRFLREAFGARVAYDGLTADDDPREGPEVERQLGLPPGARIVRQRMLVLGEEGPSVETFEVEAPHGRAADLTTLGLQHLSLLVDDIEGMLEQVVSAGGEALSEVHPNSRHEDTPGNGSVYVRAPWGMLVELQTLPHGHWYGPDSEARLWSPGRSDA